VYQDAQISAPFGSQQTVSAKLVQEVKRWGQGSNPTMSYKIDYNGNGEASRLTLPYGGYFEYEYGNGSFSNGTVVRREVSARKYCSLAFGDPNRGSQGCVAPYLKTEQFQHPNDSAYAGHTQTTINDAAGNRKIWYFTQGDALGWKNGLQWKQEVYQGAGITLLRTFRTDWTQDQPAVAELRNPRPWAQRTTLDDGKESRREQDVDANGNATQVREYGYTDPNSPLRTLTVSYLATTPYTSRNILDRAQSTALHSGGAGGPTLMSGGTTYDSTALPSITPAPNMHDPAYDASFLVRGNPTLVTPLGGYLTYTTYDILGKPRTAVDSAGAYHTFGYASSTGYTVPSSGDAGTPIGTSMQWNGDLTLSGASAASGESVSYAWDNAKRPTSATSPSGQTTTYQYNDLAQPPTVVQSTQVHTGGGPPPAGPPPPALDVGSYTITRTLDGFGRVVLTLDSRTGAYVKHEYEACSCSPNGRQVKVTNPYLSGETPLWTVSEYDALGRVTQVTAPDGSATTTSYSGNTTTVTDAAGKRKKFTYDAFGNLTQVAEPDAQGNLTVLTNYTYDVAGRLLTVSMNGGLQTRGFAYNEYGQVTSATNPENGTVTYTYGGQLLASKTDAKNQTTLFEYDSYNRLTRIHAPQGASYGHDKRFYYDSYEADPGQHIYGRLAAIEWAPPPTSPYVLHDYVHAFGYSSQGQLTRSKLTRNETYPLNPGVVNSVTLEASFTWTVQGEPASITYPSGSTWYYGFDSAGRPNALGVPYGGVAVANAAYNKAGQMTTLTAYDGTETRSYDPNTLQLTRIQVPGALDLSYVYPAAPNNNGRITAEVNNLTNTTVSYGYDQLNRLATAVSATGGSTNWGLSFSYDVYGNRTAQTVTAGTAPSFSAAFDSSNHMVGYSYDQNGNQLTTPDGATVQYDADNRVVEWYRQGVWEGYDYHPSGWRVSKVSATSDTLHLYGPGGQLLSACPVVNGVRGTCSEPVYFAGRLLWGMDGNRVYSDRLGTVRAAKSTTYPYPIVARNYYPFGEEITSTSNNDYKFASTFRDSATGLDYAVNRYYSSTTARFLTPDPLGHGSAKLTNSISWNLYVYSRNDPVNVTDATGLDVDLAALYIGDGSTTGFNGTYCVNGQASLQVHTAWTGNGVFTIHIQDLNGGGTTDSRYWVTAEGDIRVLDETKTVPGKPSQTQTYTTSQWSQSSGTVGSEGNGALDYKPFLSRNMNSDYQGSASSGTWSLNGQGPLGDFGFSVQASVSGSNVTIRQDYSHTNNKGNTTATAYIVHNFQNGVLTSFTQSLSGYVPGVGMVTTGTLLYQRAGPDGCPGASAGP